jgi:UDP-N-acetylmuramyl pentapeptide phosphotransferase/UDP-N-acetylglucosamine-1-phosphate transferase
LVYCSKCGTKNEEGAEFCVKCGASLTAPSAWRSERGRREKGEKQEQQCFGLPHGGAIVGIIIGIIVILVGISQVPGLIPREVLDVTDSFFWPIILVAFGILMVAGALYQYGRRR